jgi:hypothetical protein
MPFEGEKFEEPSTPPEEEKQEGVEKEEVEEEKLIIFDKEKGTLKAEREINKEKVEKHLEDRASEAIEKGFPFKEGDSRFNVEKLGEMDPIKYPSWRIENAKQFVKNREEEWTKKMKELPEDQREIEEEKKRAGEEAELLITAILGKGLKERFYVFRSYEYDDYKHKVDNVIIDKETGKSVVAFDAKSGKPGPEFEQQKKEIEDLNQKGGTTLEFGVKLVPDRGKMKVIPGSTGNLPLFYLSLSAKDVREGMEQFIPSEKDMSEKEKEILNHLISLIAHQIEEKQPDKYKLNLNYRDALDSFDEGLQDINLIKEKEKIRYGRRISERRAIAIEF